MEEDLEKRRKKKNLTELWFLPTVLWLCLAQSLEEKTEELEKQNNSLDQLHTSSYDRKFLMDYTKLNGL